MSLLQWRPPLQDHAHREQAQHIRGLLTEELQALLLLEKELKEQPAQGRREWVRLNQMLVTIDYLQKALAQLDKVIGAQG